MIMRALPLTLAVLLSASAVSAQAGHRHQHGPEEAPMQMHEGRMMGHGMMSHGMMGMMGEGMIQGGMGMMGTGGHGPAMLLHMKDALELTDAQVRQLEEIEAGAARARDAHLAPARAAREKAAEALAAEPPDFAGYESALQEAAQHMVQAHVAMARADVESQATLTPEQRGRIQQGMGVCGMMGRGSDMSSMHRW